MMKKIALLAAVTFSLAAMAAAQYPLPPSGGGNVAEQYPLPPSGGGNIVLN